MVWTGWRNFLTRSQTLQCHEKHVPCFHGRWTIDHGLQNNVSERCFVDRKNIVGDVASYYLPYVEDFLAIHDDIRFLCLQRSQESVTAEFQRRLENDFNCQIDHWTTPLTSGWYRDPVRSNGYPKN